MRVLFTVFPARAHVHPVVPLAWALQLAGHEVRFAIHPDAVDLVTEAGLPVVPLGARELLADAMAWNDNFAKLETVSDFLAVGEELGPEWEKQWAGLVSMLSGFTPMLGALVDFCRGWRPDLVIWDQFCVAAAVAARVSGAAHARFLWGQDNIAWFRAASRQALAQRGATEADDPVTALMAPMLDPYGLDFEEELLLGQWTIDPMPEQLRLPLDLTYVSIQRVPYTGNAILPAWLDTTPERPRVCLTLGIGGRGRQLFRTAGVSFAEVAAAVAELDVELVATLHRELTDTAGDVPRNVRLVEYMPLNYLLPTCSAIIHHGGGGSFAAAVAHRVPQLITPMPFWSESVTARYVQQHGAGLLIEPATLTTDLLRKQVTRVLTEPSFRDGADALHQEMRKAVSPAAMVGVLEELTADRRH